MRPTRRAALIGGLSGLSAALLAGCATGPRAAAGFTVEARPIRSPGGVAAWLASDPTVPIIVLQASFRGGSAGDPAGRFGLTSAVAGMLDEGAGGLNADAFKVRLEELNMGFGGASGWDFLDVSLTTLTRAQDAAFDLAGLALAQPRFDQAPLERLKRASEVSLKTRETDPNWIAGRAITEHQLAGHPYARTVQAADIAALDPASLRARHAQLMRRDGLVVTIAGDVSEAGAGVLLDRLFGGLPAQGPALSATPPAAIALGPATVVRPLPQPQSLIRFSAPGLFPRDPDYIALQVANYIIGGGGFSSRLMNEVREKRGLVYGVGVGASALKQAAFLSGSARSENGDAAQSLAVIQAELARFATGGATAEELADAKRYLTGAFPLSFDSNAKIASVLHGYQLDDRPIDYVNGYTDRIAAVTLADVARVARLYDPERFIFAVVGEPTGLT